jgi:hypothetical protein
MFVSCVCCVLGWSLSQRSATGCVRHSNLSSNDVWAGVGPLQHRMQANSCRIITDHVSQTLLLADPFGFEK